MSPRQFSRAFRAETGQPPAKAVEHMRVEVARLMMEQSRHPIDVVATETGFADSDRMRRAFMRTLGQPPQTIRRNARRDPVAEPLVNLTDQAASSGPESAMALTRSRHEAPGSSRALRFQPFCQKAWRPFMSAEVRSGMAADSFSTGQSHHAISSNRTISSSVKRLRMGFAGLPPTMA